MACIAILIIIFCVSFVYQSNWLTSIEWTVSLLIGWTGMDLLKGRH